MRRLAIGYWLINAIIVICGGMAVYAVSNDHFVTTWTPATDQDEQYEFRWRHFASPEWIALPTMPGRTGSMLVTFKSLPDSPLTDRWMCVDARMVQPTVGPWLSETTAGPACNTVDVSIIPVPTPPAPLPPPIPPPAPVPPLPPPDTFSNLANSKGVLSFDYPVAECKRGVQQMIGALKNGARTITLICRR